MAEEPATEETSTPAQATAEAGQAQRDGHGPGFVLGVVVGMVAGAAAATLFAPTSGDQLRHRMSDEVSLGTLEESQGPSEGQFPATPMNRVRTLLARARSRVREAAAEGREAAREAEERSRARYAELIRKEL